MIRHAGLVAARIGGDWLGALIEGPSAAGKSDLALRALDAGFRLVADDRTLVWTSGGRLWGRAPDSLAGQIEVRGLGILTAEPLAFARIALLVRLGAPERLPDPQSETVLGVALPVATLQGLDASAPAKLGHALRHLGAGRQRAYLGAPAARELQGPARGFR